MFTFSVSSVLFSYLLHFSTKTLANAQGCNGCNAKLSFIVLKFPFQKKNLKLMSALYMLCITLG